MEEELNNFLTVKEALPYFRITSEQTFYTWMRNDKLPDKLTEKVGGVIFVRKNILKSFLLGETA